MSTTFYTVASERSLNSAIAAINAASTSDPAGTQYMIVLSADLLLTANIQTISLAAGQTLTIEGLNYGNDFNTALIDGDGAHRGFVVNAGSVAFSNLDLTGLTAPGGSGGTPGGGGALYVGAGAVVSTNSVALSGSASGGTPAGGAVFLAAGGSLGITGGSLSGSGHNGLFIQGSNSVTLDGVGATGVIADETGSHLGAGVGTVIAQGAVTLSAGNSYTGGTQIQGALTLLSSTAAGAGAISFTSASGESLVAAPGDAPANQIDGFVLDPSGWQNGDAIDLQGIGTPASAKLTGGNHLIVTGSAGTVALNLDPTHSYAGDTFVLTADAGTGAAAGALVQVAQSGFRVASEADLNAALAAIDLGGPDSAPHTAYAITLTAGFTLGSDLNAINLAPTESLVINGAGATIDGAGTFRGFFAFAGHLTLENLTIQNALARGGDGGTGATPGGGGAGLGGGLFVNAGATVTLANVTFADDHALGGSAGGIGGVGIGGGGGLGGEGGAAGGTASLPQNGGGGGIGVASTGGSLGSSGGTGIILGAAGGNAGTGNHPAGGAGGADGGGGGAAGIILHSGSGRGGHATFTPGASGSGGVGGSFGGGAGAQAAGFGGGGANSAGGWGGGGSGASAGGFGGGSGAGGAGGGLGAGGAIFVAPGGALNFAAGSVAGGAVAGGAGNSGGAGSAFGSGLFFGGGNRVALNPANGNTLTLSDVITDATGSGGAGATTLILNGRGTVVLSATNTWRGGSILDAGTFSLQAPGAAGSGAITFAYGDSATLIVGAGDVPANKIVGFLPGDSIDLQGIGTATGTTLGAGNVLAITGGAVPVALTLDPAQNFTGESFQLSPDGAGGIWLTATDIQNDLPPYISGAGSQAGNDHAALSPLAGIKVSDAIAGTKLTATVTLSSTGNGTLSNLGGGSYDVTAGVYTVTGSAAGITAAIDGLVFTPKIHEVAPGHAVTTLFTVSATDGLMTATPKTENLRVTALNDPPVISGVPFTVVEGYWNVPLHPFPTAVVTDPDVGARETVTLWGGSLALSMPGMTLTQTSTGYTLSPGTPAQVTAALRALTFTGQPNPSVPGYTINNVSMSVSDGTAAATAHAEVLTGLPIFSGTVANQTVTDGQSINPFSTVAVTDSAGLSIQNFSIVLYDSSSNYLNPTDANGTLSGADLTKTGVGTYTLAAGASPAAVSGELDALTFTPAVANTTVTTDFLLSAFDGATTADNSDISVVASPAPAAASIPATFTAADIFGTPAIAPANVTTTNGVGGVAPIDNGAGSWPTWVPSPEIHW